MVLIYAPCAFNFDRAPPPLIPSHVVAVRTHHLRATCLFSLHISFASPCFYNKPGVLSSSCFCLLCVFFYSNRKIKKMALNHTHKVSFSHANYGLNNNINDDDDDKQEKVGGFIRRHKREATHRSRFLPHKYVYNTVISLFRCYLFETIVVVAAIARSYAPPPLPLYLSVFWPPLASAYTGSDGTFCTRENK